jgi:hypothetical protein
VNVVPLKTGVPNVSVAAGSLLLALTVNVREVPAGADCGTTVKLVMVIVSVWTVVDWVAVEPSESVTVIVIVATAI